jgi:8-oxo-dGTP pyrophosphatase MutT (NUDIX family)
MHMPKIRSLSSRIAHKNKWYRIRHHKILKPDGTVGDYFMMEREPFTIVVAYRNGKFLLIEENRFTTGTRVLDFPGGWLNPREDPKASALREFEEETGYRAEDAELLCAPYAAVGIARYRCYIYRTVGKLKKVGQKLDATEAGLRSVWKTRMQIAEICRGEPEISGDLLRGLAAFDLAR